MQKEFIGLWTNNAYAKCRESDQRYSTKISLIINKTLSEMNENIKIIFEHKASDRKET